MHGKKTERVNVSIGILFFIYGFHYITTVSHTNTIVTKMVTKTLNIRIPEEQYMELEEIVKVRHYTSKAEFVRELLREATDEYIEFVHREANTEKERYTPLRDYGKSKGLE